VRTSHYACGAFQYRVTRVKHTLTLQGIKYTARQQALSLLLSLLGPSLQDRPRILLWLALLSQSVSLDFLLLRSSVQHTPRRVAPKTMMAPIWSRGRLSIQ
jgi:hypothetical protein